MLKIYLNGKETYIEKGATLYQIRKQFKPEADLIIRNSFPSNGDISIEDGDHIFLIKKMRFRRKMRWNIFLFQGTPPIFMKN